MDCLEWQSIPANARTWMCGPGIVVAVKSRQGWLVK
ncbi:MAG: hypothetical protein JWR16_2700 [Nevskia sp.]|nr:hypothetical protein [Nevskia sp.]